MQSTRTATASTRSLASSTATWIPSAARRLQPRPMGTAWIRASPTVDTDCNDADNTIYPGATEVPDDAIDQDCDTSTRSHASLTATWIPSAARRLQPRPMGTAWIRASRLWTPTATTQTTPSTPARLEVPDDAIDQDCDGFDTVTCFVDGDLDTFGSTYKPTTSADGDCLESGESLRGRHRLQRRRQHHLPRRHRSPGRRDRPGLRSIRHGHLLR